MHPNNVGRDIIGESDDWGDHGLKYAQIARESRIANSKKVQNFTSELLATYNATTPNEIIGYEWINEYHTSSPPNGKMMSNRHGYTDSRGYSGYYNKLHSPYTDVNPIGNCSVDAAKNVDCTFPESINNEFENWAGSPGPDNAINRGRQDIVTKYSMYVPVPRATPHFHVHCAVDGFPCACVASARPARSSLYPLMCR